MDLFLCLCPMSFSFSPFPWKAAVTQSELENADPEDAFQQALSGSLHQETRLFDFGRQRPRCFMSWLPALETCELSFLVQILGLVVR